MKNYLRLPGAGVAALVLCMCVFCGTLNAQSPQIDFNTLFLEVEEDASIRHTARELAIEHGQPINILIQGVAIIDAYGYEYNPANDRTDVVYIVLTDFIDVFNGSYTAFYEEIESTFDLSEAEIRYNLQSIPKKGGKPVARYLTNNTAPLPDGLILIPHQTVDGVMAFDRINGNLVDMDFIPADPDNLSTPIAALPDLTGIGDVFVSDQIDDVVQRYDMDGLYLGVFASNMDAMNNVIMNNIRGIEWSPEGNLLVTQGSAPNTDFIVEFDSDGNHLGNFISLGDNGNTFDILFWETDGSYLIGSLGSDVVAKYDINGSFVELLLDGCTFPEQIAELPDGRVAVAHFTAFNAGDGITADVHILGTDGQIEMSIMSTLSGLRGVYLLGNGNLLVTNSGGVHEMSLTGEVIETKVTGGASFIHEYGVPLIAGECGIICPDDIVIDLGPGECDQIVSYSVIDTGQCAGLELVLAEGLSSGSVFPEGTTTVVYQMVNNEGEVAAMCSFDVTINPYSGPVSSSLACNDLVFVSVDEECMAFVTPDMILEGGPYKCYDDYLVAIQGFGSGLGGVSLNGNAVGQTLNVTITDPENGNSCWGHILVEDKLIPPLQCEDIEVFCGDNITPGEPTAFETVIHASANLESIVFGNAVACPGGDYQYLRVIDLQALGLNTTEITPHTFRMGVESSGGGINATLRVYTFTDPNDYTAGQMGFNYADLTQIGTDNMGVIPALNLEFWEMPVNGVTVPAGTRWLVWELQVPGGNFVDFVMGSNTAGEDLPTYLASDFCGIPEPATLLSVGFPGNWVSMLLSTYQGPFPFPLPDDATVVPPSGNGPFTVLNFDPCGPATLTFMDIQIGELCTGQEVSRLWTITDGSGNTATCVQTISINPLELDQAQCPPTYVGTCGQSTHPDVTGYPTVAGHTIKPGGFCNIFVAYSDHEFEDCGGGIKIARTWDLLDWCTETSFLCEQIIKLSDEEGPELDCPDDITVVTDPWFCHKDVNLYPPEAYDVCGTPFTLSVSVSAGTLISFGGNYRVDDLPIGEHIVTWTATDDCGNTNTCTYTITVVDEIPPVPLCDEHTVVSLTFDDPLDEGLTKIDAYVFDDGSYDNCTPVSFEARRVPSCIDFDWTTNGAGIDEIPNGIVDSRDRGQVFREKVPFACCDVGAGPVMVELRVSDEYGNVNTCMVEVNVQDKLPPFIECPPDVHVSCEFWFDAHETNGFVDLSEDVTSHVFGVVLDAYEYDEEDREDIIIDDPGRPTNPNHPDYLPQPFNWGLDGWADDNCDVEITVRVRIFDDCSGDDFPVAAPHPYAVRLVERTFRARDNQGNSSTCIQRIWVIDFEPFYISDQTCVNSDPNDGVIWPCDKTYTTCPDEIPVDYPTIFDDNCSLIGVTYEDQRFDFIDNACYKILRTWTVIDWCQYDVNTGAGYWTHVQVIKVLDHDPAEFLDCPDGPVTLCVADPGVELPANNQVFLGENDPQSTSCSVHVRIEHTVYETCSDWVEYDVKFYPHNGSTYWQVVNKTKVTTDTANEAVLVMDTKSSALLSVRQNGLPYNDRYCLGIGGPKDYHRILWSVEDGCGNLNTCEYLLRLEDCKQPSPVCVGLSSVVMPSSGEVTIWAVDFNASSFDDCTAAKDLLYSFSGDTYQPSHSFDCDEIVANGSPSFIVEIWVADEGNDQDCNGVITWDERNKDYCTTFIVIDDNEGICPGGGSASIGVVQTEIQEPVEDVTLNLTAGNGSITQTYTTEKDGMFHFFVPILDYKLDAERNDNHKNGVSTLDLVNIQKHLLGIEALDSPYKLIAADANNSQSVSAIDLVELRKLILGIHTELPNNKSWRFVDAEYVFADANNPWPYSEVIELQPGAMNVDDFVGVKIGDVNETVTANANQVHTRDARGILNLLAAEQTVTAGQEVKVDVYASNFDGIYGYQFTLRTEGLDLQDVTPGAIDMGTENVGIHKSAITASWHSPVAIAAGDGNVLFTLSFVATQSGQLSDMLSISSLVTEAEAYASTSLSTSSGNEEILDVKLVIESSQVVTGAKEYALFQNEPNPFKAETAISFTLPEAMEATITVFDVTGKVVHLVDGDFDAGYNEIKLRQKELRSTGVLYYRLDADNFTATKKMVLID